MFVATDFDGDSVVIDAGATVTIENDVPINYAPDSKTITDIAGSVMTGSLHTIGNIGADEPGTATITSLAKGGKTYTIDGATTTLTSNAQVIFLYGFGTDELTGSTDANFLDGLDPAQTIFTVTVNASTDMYQVNLFKPIDNGSGVVLNDLGFATAGNKAFNYIDVPSTTDDILFSGFHLNNDGDTWGLSSTFDSIGTVNSNSTAIGVDNQSMNDGDVLGIDFVNSPSVANGANNFYNYGRALRHQQLLLHHCAKGRWYRNGRYRDLAPCLRCGQRRSRRSPYGHSFRCSDAAL